MATLSSDKQALERLIQSEHVSEKIKAEAKEQLKRLENETAQPGETKREDLLATIAGVKVLIKNTSGAEKKRNQEYLLELEEMLKEHDANQGLSGAVKRSRELDEEEMAKGGQVHDKKKKSIYATYNEKGYEIWDNNGEQIYQAGNNRFDSSQSAEIDSSDALSLSEIKKYAQHTGSEIAKENNAIFTGVQYEEIDEYKNGGEVIGGVKHEKLNATDIDYHKMNKLDELHPLGDVYSDGEYGYIASGHSWLKFPLKDLKKINESEYKNGGDISGDGKKTYYVYGINGEEKKIIMPIDAYDFEIGENNNWFTYFNPNKKDDDGHDYLEIVDVGFEIDENNTFHKRNQYKNGGLIKDQYEGKSAEYVWNKWTIKQREHFLYDHIDKKYYIDIPKYLSAKFNLLPNFIENAVHSHVHHGQYKDGGSVFSFSNDTDKWFDDVADFSEKKENQGKLDELIKISEKAASKYNLIKFKEKLESCECEKEETKKHILSQINKILNNEYKEFKHNYGGRYKSYSRVSATSSFFSSFHQAATYHKFEDGGKVGTKYWILKHSNSGAPTTVHETDKFNKEELQKKFDEEAKKLQIGESLEYGKEDSEKIYPAMLDVEMTKTGLKRITDRGRVKYNAKFKDGGSVSNMTLHFRYIEITPKQNGLEVKLNKEGKEYVNEEKESGKTDYEILPDLFEDMQANTGNIYHSNLGESGLGMTDSEGITEGYIMNEEGEYEPLDDDSAVYYFNDSAIYSPLEKMLEDAAFFTKAYENGGKIELKSFEITAPSNKENVLKDFIKQRHITKFNRKESDNHVTYIFNVSDINDVKHFKDMSMKYEFKFSNGGELKKGEEVEKEHISTAKKLYSHEITPEQAAKSIAKEHLEENPEYYTKLEQVEKHEYKNGGDVKDTRPIKNELTREEYNAIKRTAAAADFKYNPDKDRYVLKEHLIYKEKTQQKGETIPNHYHDKSEKEIWDIWTTQQRRHFLGDHSHNEKFGTSDEYADYLDEKSQSSYEDLSDNIKIELKHHKHMGSYEKGGKIGHEDIWDIDFVKIQKKLETHPKISYFSEEGSGAYEIGFKNKKSVYATPFWNGEKEIPVSLLTDDEEKPVGSIKASKTSFKDDNDYIDWYYNQIDEIYNLAFNSKSREEMLDIENELEKGGSVSEKKSAAKEAFELSEQLMDKYKDNKDTEIYKTDSKDWRYIAELIESGENEKAAKRYNYLDTASQEYPSEYKYLILKKWVNEHSDVRLKKDGGSVSEKKSEHYIHPEHKEYCDKGTHVQSILFPKSKFTLAQARNWLRKHQYRFAKIDRKSPNNYRARQESPLYFRKDSFRTISFGSTGIQAIIGCPTKKYADGGEIGDCGCGN